ncbi:hypothetical protein ACHAXA_009513 [Cyclostephanos tholiformis]|uniref:Man1/Src1 C-terminal domain-containing protein n=1 Tax=Cyclostephanos tholiformis TaxID=382380 RepID=A0ABD3RYG8_9STRA
MPPKKRKADTDSPAGGDVGDATYSPAPKKSKSQIKAEQLARAKAWHDARTNKAKGGDTAASSSSFPSGTTTTPTKSSGGRPSLSPSPFAAGTTTMKSPVVSAKKRRRTTTPSGGGRKSTGGISSGVVGDDSLASASPPQPPTSSLKRRDEAEEEGSKPEMMGGDGGSGGKKNDSENKKKRRDGLARIRALEEARASKGLADDRTKKRKSPPVMTNSNDSPTKAFEAESVTRTSTTASSSDSPAIALSALSAVAHVHVHAAAAGAKPAPTSAKNPPAAVASLFSSSQPAIKYSTSSQVYDPNRPFPSTGRSLPAAAYAGCGPRCVDSGGYPPSPKRWNGSNDDERKISSRPSPPGRDEIFPPPPRPSPPGRNHNGDEVDGEVKQAADVGGERIVTSAPAIPAPVAAAPMAAADADEGLLHASISRVRAIVSLASAGNQRRRTMMGIRGSELTEAQPLMESIRTADVDMSRGRSVDPPIMNSPSIACSATLQKFRDSTEASRMPKDRTNRAVDHVVVTSDAGERTSEVGVDSEVKPSASSKPGSDKPPSFFRRSCICVGKGLMFMQIGIGLSYLTTAFYKNDFIPIDLFTTPANMPEEDRMYCFIDYPHSDVLSDDGDQQNLYDERKCEGRHKQCPQWGRCRAGKLLDCIDGAGTFAGRNLFVPNKSGDGCEVSPEANELVEVVKETLAGMTTDQFCQREVEGIMLKNDTFPLFRLEKVVAKVRDLPNGSFALFSLDLLLWLSPAFDSGSVCFGTLSGDDDGDFDAMGLGHEVSPDSLPLPISCRIKLLFWELLGYLSHFALALIKYSAGVTFYLSWHYPIQSFCGIGMTYLFIVLQRKRKHLAKVREVIGIVREAAYDRLAECDDHTGYAALLLRDDVGHDMYPTSFVQRQFLYDYVWPRVVLEVRADNRVRKFRKMIAGKELEHWDFAIQSKKGRRLRKSLGTPVQTPRDGNGSGVKADDVSPKRDP